MVTAKSNSSKETCFFCAIACRDAVRKASGKNKPPNHKTYFCKFEVMWSSASCANRRLKSANHSVTVIWSCTAYFLHPFGTASVFMSEINCRISLVVFWVPSQVAASNFKSARTLASSDLAWPISRSKQRQRGSLSDASVLSMMGTDSGSDPKIDLTFVPNSRSGFAIALDRLLFPAFLALGTLAAEPCSANHLANVWFALLILNICSACTGRPIQVGLPFAGKSSIHCKNCSRFRASGDARSCSLLKAIFNLKSLLKLSSLNKCWTKALKTW
mmetsp:Transcript_40043/g.100532  ORF Transcript_40043/g.100532 Transcript_40043/m.100532 type:complete len:273 (-) Transcript_40043:4343-5161(-)